MGIGFGNEIIHQGQAGASAGNGLFHPAAQDIGPIPPGSRQTGQLPIVAGVDSVGDALLRLCQDSQYVADHVQLRAPRLAPGHVQLQPPGLPGIQLLLHLTQLLLQTGGIEILIRLHDDSPFSLPVHRGQNQHCASII